MNLSHKNRATETLKNFISWLLFIVILYAVSSIASHVHERENRLTTCMPPS